MESSYIANVLRKRTVHSRQIPLIALSQDTGRTVNRPVEAKDNDHDELTDDLIERNLGLSKNYDLRINKQSRKELDTIILSKKIFFWRSSS